MDALKGLALIETMESRLMRLYGVLSRRFSQDEKAKLFFVDMHKEERTHLEIARMETRLIKDARQTHADAIMDEAEISRVLTIVEKLIKEELPLNKTLEMVHDIEHSAAELYVLTALKHTDPKVSNLLLTMGETFRLHRAFVHDFLESYGIDASDLEHNDEFLPRSAGNKKAPAKDTALLISSREQGQDELIVYSGAIESVGFEVIKLPGRTEAIKFFKDAPPVKIIFLEIESEDEENFKFISEIRKSAKYARIPVVVMTTSYDKEFQSKAKARGTTLILHKMTTTPDKLKGMLHSWRG
jgi:PleD family two-component response regulator